MNINIVPRPDVTTSLSHQFEQLTDDNAIEIKDGNIRSIRAMAHQYAKQTGRKLSVRTADDNTIFVVLRN
jgi:hypothetical protein